MTHILLKEFDDEPISSYPEINTNFVIEDKYLTRQNFYVPPSVSND